ncbi:MAG: hypothetical protein IJX16_00180 [Clostridia bacterium]|nr:hypothetical protein [Clostridia bacterium]
MTVEIKGLGKITASKEVLNTLSSLIWESSESYENRGRKALAKDASDIANAIYDELDKANYYN